MSDKTNAMLRVGALSMAEKAHKRAYVHKRLRELGLNDLELIRAEARFLPELLSVDEEIGGVAVGYSEKQGHIMLVATDSRIITIDCKPFFRDSEDISYYAIDGVTTGSVGVFHSLSLHTRTRNIKIKTFYGKAVGMFKWYINERCLRLDVDPHTQVHL